MIAESIIPAARRGARNLATAPRSAVSSAHQVSRPEEAPGIPTEKLLWLGKYLRVKKETSDSWILSEMGWLMENTVHSLAEVINRAFDRLFSAVVDIVPVAIARAPLLNIDSIQSKLTAQSVSIELECDYKNDITGTRYDIDQALHLLLHMAPRLCEGQDIQQRFTLLDYWNAPLLQITHPVTEVPPEMFEYLFNSERGGCSCRNGETTTRLELVVQKCNVTYNLDADSRNGFIVLTIVSRLGIVAVDEEASGSAFLPLTAAFQCTISEE